MALEHESEYPTRRVAAGGGDCWEDRLFDPHANRLGKVDGCRGRADKSAGMPEPGAVSGVSLFAAMQFDRLLSGDRLHRRSPESR